MGTVAVNLGSLGGDGEYVGNITLGQASLIAGDSNPSIQSTGGAINGSVFGTLDGRTTATVEFWATPGDLPQTASCMVCEDGGTRVFKFGYF